MYACSVLGTSTTPAARFSMIPNGCGVDYDATGKCSKAAETRKKKAYAPAKAREEARWWRQIRFIPLAFEISGGWGEEMAKFFEECVRLKKRRRSAEKYHWCAILNLV